MAKRNLTKVLASMEEVSTVEVANPKASLDAQVETTESQVPTGLDPNDVSAKGGKDYTAMDAASERQGIELAKRIERLSDAGGSLESYLGVIRNCRVQGKSLPAAAAKIMRADLGTMYPKAFSGMTVALEDIDDASESTALTTTKSAETEGKGALAKVSGAVKAAIQKFIAMMKDLVAKAQELYQKVKESIKGSKAKSDELSSVIKALPAPGKKITSVPTATAGTKAAAAMKQLQSSGEPVAQPPAGKVSVGPASLATDGGELNLSDNTAIDAACKYVTDYSNAVVKLCTDARKTLDDYKKSQPSGSFDNDNQKGSIKQLMETHLGKLTPPDDDIGGWMFQGVDNQPGVYRYQLLEEYPDTVEIELPPRPELTKFHASTDKAVASVASMNEATAKATTALADLSKYLEAASKELTVSLSNWILLPAALRTPLWAVPNHLQRVISSRINCIDHCILLHLKAGSAQVAENAKKLAEN